MNSERLAKIAESVGFTLWQLQELERCTADYYVLVFQATQGVGVEAGVALSDEASSKTFGKTVSRLIKEEHFPKEIEVRFQSILAERNWLVHNSRATSRTAVYNDIACQNLLRRIGAISVEALALLKEIGQRAESFVMSHGVSRQEIDKGAEEILHSWRNPD